MTSSHSGNLMVEALREMALDEYNKLVAEYPRQQEHGGQLFIGNHYGESDLLFLGLAPQLDDSNVFDVDFPDSNRFFESGAKRGYRRNAALTFTINETLRDKMATASFCYCCPFKTKKWSELAEPRKELFLSHSRPLLHRILEDCQPKFIIVSGQESVSVLREYFGDIFTGFEQKDLVDMDRTHRWSAYEIKIYDRPAKLLKAPDFNYSSHKGKLFHLSNWLFEKISRSY